MSGFRKCGIFPINPGAVTDRQLEPSKAFMKNKEVGSTAVDDCALDKILFTEEEQELHQKRFQEGFDIAEPSYVAWLKIYHPNKVSSAPNSSEGSSLPSIATTTVTIGSEHDESSTTTSDVLSDILVLPKPKEGGNSRRRKKALNSKAVCITDDDILESLRAQEEEKLQNEKMKETKRLERIEKKKVKDLEKIEKKQQNDQRRQQREEEKRQKEEEKRRKEEERRRKEEEKEEEKRQKEIEKKRKEEEKEEEKRQKEEKRRQKKEEKNNGTTKRRGASRKLINQDDEDVQCPKCGMLYDEDDTSELWICCDACNCWYDFKCSNIKSIQRIPKFYYCDMCK